MNERMNDWVDGWIGGREFKIEIITGINRKEEQADQMSGIIEVSWRPKELQPGDNWTV